MKSTYGKFKKTMSEYNYYSFMGLPDSVRKQVFERDGNICVYCKGSSGNTRLTVDHVIPKGYPFKPNPQSKGSHDLDNLVTACNSCNSRKGSKTLIEWIKNAKVKISIER